jgi:hypothetical protein
VVHFNFNRCRLPQWRCAAGHSGPRSPRPWLRIVYMYPPPHVSVRKRPTRRGLRENPKERLHALAEFVAGYSFVSLPPCQRARIRTKLSCEVPLREPVPRSMVSKALSKSLGLRSRVVAEEPNDARPESQARFGSTSPPIGKVRCVGPNPCGNVLPEQTEIEASFLQMVT